MKILLAIDDSAGSAAAAQALAAYPRGSELRILHVVEWPARLPSCYTFALGAAADACVLAARERMIAEADALVERYARSVRRLGFKPQTFVLVGDASEEIVKCAARWGVDLIVMGTRGAHGLDRLAFGSVARAVVRHARCPVETVHSEPSRVAGDALSPTPSQDATMQ